MGFTNNTKKGVENLPLKRREPVKHRANLTVEGRLEALETRVDTLVEELMQLNARLENYQTESRGRFERIEQGQAQMLEMMGRLEQQGHYPPPPTYGLQS